MEKINKYSINFKKTCQILTYTIKNYVKPAEKVWMQKTKKLLSVTLGTRQSLFFAECPIYGTRQRGASVFKANRKGFLKNIFFYFKK